MARVVDRILTPDAHARVNGTAFFTFAHPDERGVPLGSYVSEYRSREELSEAIRTGVYLPMWSGPSMTRRFKGLRAYDGGFRQNMPCPPGVTYCVTVSALPPVTWPQVVHALLEPGTMRVLQRALTSTLGARPLQFAANVLLPNRNGDWSLGKVLFGTLAYFSGVNPDPSVQIYPGKYSKMPYSLAEWLAMLVIPPSPGDIDVLVQMGERDAAAWAAEHGLMAAEEAAAVHARPLEPPQRGA